MPTKQHIAATELAALDLLGSSGIGPRTPVAGSYSSAYGDQVWDFWGGGEDERRQGGRYRWSIDWEKVAERHALGPEALEEIRRWAFCWLLAPGVLFSGKKYDNGKPNTMVANVWSAARLFGTALKLRFGDAAGVARVSDLSWDAVLEALVVRSTERRPERAVDRSTLRVSQNEKIILAQLASPGFQRYAGVPIRWTLADARALVVDETEPWTPLPRDLFVALSDHCTSGVRAFLVAAGRDPEDTGATGLNDAEPVEPLPHFRARVAAFLRDARRRNIRSFHARQNWLREIDQPLHRHLFKVRDQALTTIAQYTGMRQTEMRSLKGDCLFREGALWKLRGTVVKDNPLADPIQANHWTVIGAVVDAVRVFQITNRWLNFTGPLLSGDAKRWSRSFDALRDEVDPEGRFAAEHVHLHRFRHSLTLELFRAGLGLPFITYQLHHALTSITYVANQVTLQYGGIGPLVPLRAAKRAGPRSCEERAGVEAAYEILREIYHPDSPVAGGGATFIRARRASYFDGMTAREIDDELRRRAREGSFAMASVGLGDCLQSIAAATYVPPCVGGLMCNPWECENGIVRPRHLAAWEDALAEDERRRADPAYEAHWPVLDFFIAYKRRVIASAEEMLRVEEG